MKQVKIDKNFIVREVAGEYILIPVGEAALKFNGVFSVTEVGAEIWKGLTEGKKKEEIITCILEEYEVDETSLRTDYDAFIDRIRELSLITEE